MTMNIIIKHKVVKTKLVLVLNLLMVMLLKQKEIKKLLKVNIFWIRLMLLILLVAIL